MRIPGPTLDAMLAPLVEALNTATGTPSMEVYTGTMPAALGLPIGDTFLGAIDLPKPVGEIVDGVLTFDVVSDTPLAAASGAPGWVRLMTGESDEAFYMSAGGPTSGAEVVFNVDELIAGQELIVLSGSVALNRGAIPPGEPGGGGGEVDPAVQSNILLAGLLHWWDFDETSGAVFADAHGAADLSIVDLDGANTATTYGAAGGNPGGKFNPMATNRSGTAYSPLPGARPPVAAFSFGCWFARNGATWTGDGRIMGWHGGASEDPIVQLRLAGLSPEVYAVAYDDPMNEYYTGESAVFADEGERIFAVVTVNLGAQRLEVRAQRATGEMAYAQVAMPAPLRIDAGVNLVFCGALDNDTLSAFSPNSELTLVDGGFVSTVPMTTALFAYLFNGGAGIDYAQLIADAG